MSRPYDPHELLAAAIRGATLLSKQLLAPMMVGGLAAGADVRSGLGMRTVAFSGEHDRRKLSITRGVNGCIEYRAGDRSASDPRETPGTLIRPWLLGGKTPQ
jgi:hypothetical protein